jgi:predicted GIY-YIG superfamily endonuclease
MEAETSIQFFYSYILQSTITGGLYIGYTSDLEKRPLQHNESNGKYTSNKGPWVFIFYKKFDTKREAISLERHLKQWKSKKRVLEWIEREKFGNNPPHN